MKSDMMHYVIGVDVGTQSTKALLLGLDGRIMAQASVGYQVESPQQKWAQQWPEVWFNAVCQTITECVATADIPPDRIRGLCVSTLYGGSGIAVDTQMRPLYPCLIWMDRRAGEQVEWVRQHVDTEKLLQITGNNIDSYYGYTKILWIKHNHPEIWRQIHYFLPPNSYINYLLTGQIAVDHSSAGNIGGVYDIRKRCWSAEAMEMLDIPLRMMPPRLVSSSAQVGGLLPEIADKLGLPVGLPVMAGGIDAAVATLAAGVLEAGDHVAMMGTSMCWGYINSEVDARHGLISMPYVINSERDNYIFGGAITAGAAVSWFRDTFCEQEIATAAAEGRDVHELLEQQAAAVAPGSAGLLFLPYLMGERSPIWDPLASGTWLGLNLSHGKGHLYRAVLEGIAFALRDNIECGKQGAARLEPRLIVVGGAARSDLWMQIIADVTGYPLFTILPEVEAPLGDACLAALGCGLLQESTVIRDWMTLQQRATPDRQYHRHYSQLFDEYRVIYRQLKSSMHRLNALAEQRTENSLPQAGEGKGK